MDILDIQHPKAIEKRSLGIVPSFVCFFCDIDASADSEDETY